MLAFTILEEKCSRKLPLKNVHTDEDHNKYKPYT